MGLGSPQNTLLQNGGAGGTDDGSSAIGVTYSTEPQHNNTTSANMEIDVGLRVGVGSEPVKSEQR